MKIISCINLKGGCAKTTTIVNLGGIFHEKKKKVLLIDMDPQQSALKWSVQGGKQFPFPVVAVNANSISSMKLNINKLIDQYNPDFLLIDTPPQLEECSLFSALLSDLVMIPVSPSPLDIWAAEQAINTIREAGDTKRCSSASSGLKVVIVPSRVIARSSIGKDISTSLKHYNETVSPPIASRVSFAESAIAGTPISIYAPNTPAHKDFQSLWKCINKIISK